MTNQKNIRGGFKVLIALIGIPVLVRAKNLKKQIVRSSFYRIISLKCELGFSGDQNKLIMKLPSDAPSNKNLQHNLQLKDSISDIS